MNGVPMTEMSDYPKLECPFVRKTYPISKEDWKKHGSELQLRTPEVYLVTPEVSPGFEWVFEDSETIAVEKLDGSNVKMKIENGRLVALQNRKNIIDPLQIGHGKTFIIEGVFRALDKGYDFKDGEHAGELIGPKLQGNPYQLDHHIWYPFEKTISSLSYKTYQEHPKTFENLSEWFRLFLRSRFYQKERKIKFEESIFAEGAIFYNFKRKAEGKSWQAKLRRNMFDWYYKDKIRIEGI